MEKQSEEQVESQSEERNIFDAIVDTGKKIAGVATDATHAVVDTGKKISSVVNGAAEAAVGGIVSVANAGAYGVLNTANTISNGVVGAANRFIPERH